MLQRDRTTVAGRDCLSTDELSQLGAAGRLPRARARHLDRCAFCQSVADQLAAFDPEVGLQQLLVARRGADAAAAPGRSRASAGSVTLALMAIIVLVSLGGAGWLAMTLDHERSARAIESGRARALSDQLDKVVSDAKELRQRLGRLEELSRSQATETTNFVDAWLESHESKAIVGTLSRQTQLFDALLGTTSSLPVPAEQPGRSTVGGYVYLGVCGPAGWESAYFDGLPTCRGGEVADLRVPAKIKARDGRFVRSTPSPSGGALARLKPREMTELVGLRNVTVAPVPGSPRMYWGQVNLRQD